MGHVKAYEGLRGLLAIWVILGHWGTAIAWPVHRIPPDLWNVRAVDVFVILSGFAMATLIDQKHEPYLVFIARRFLRIFPVYWLYLLLSVVSVGVAYQVWSTPGPGVMQDARAAIARDSIEHFWAQLLVHIPALHALVPERILSNSAYAFLGQAWSISLEWQFYLIVPVVLLLGAAAMRSARWAALLAVLLLGLAWVSTRLPQGFVGGYSLLFAVGILTYFYLAGRARGDAWAMRLPIAQTALAVVVVVGLLDGTHLLPLAIWAVVSAAAAWGDNVPAALRPVPRLLNLPAVQTLGRMSYSIYLSHMLVLTLMLAVLQQAGIVQPLASAGLLLAGTLVGTWALSTLSFMLVERPFQQLGRRLSARATPARVTKAALVPGKAL